MSQRRGVCVQVMKRTTKSRILALRKVAKDAADQWPGSDFLISGEGPQLQEHSILLVLGWTGEGFDGGRLPYCPWGRSFHRGKARRRSRYKMMARNGLRQAAGVGDAKAKRATGAAQNSRNNHCRAGAKFKKKEEKGASRYGSRRWRA